MNKTSLIAIAGLSILLAAGPALAQKRVYRCDTGGKVTYGDAPCKGGAEVAVDDARSEADRKAARDAVQREEKTGDKMQRERLAAEARAAKQGAAHIPYSAASAAAAGVTPKKPARPAKAKTTPSQG